MDRQQIWEDLGQTVAVQERESPWLLRSRQSIQRLDDIRRICISFTKEDKRSTPPQELDLRVADIMGLLGDVFHGRAMQICFLLDHHSVLRFNQLMDVLPHVSSRTLSSKLALLKEHGLITRDRFDEAPPRVEYRLSARGESLVALLTPAILHMGTIFQEREGIHE